MIGRQLQKYTRKKGTTIGDVALEVERLTLPGAFKDISFKVRKGEIVGLGGLVGAGRSDVACALFGVTPAQTGTISINGKKFNINQPSDVIKHCLAFVPKERAVAEIFGILTVM